ncbi:MAG: serine protease [Bacilli bacterium]|nr:serine protease [Bacilli bacterium]
MRSKNSFAKKTTTRKSSLVIFCTFMFSLLLSFAFAFCHAQRNLISVRESFSKAVNTHDDCDPVQLRVDGDLSSTQFGTFDNSHQVFSYSLTYTSQTNTAYSILTTSSYGVSLKVYYLDGDMTHCFISANNVISFLPVSSVRTAYIQVEPLVSRRTYNFTIYASEIPDLTSSYDYVVYTPATKKLEPKSYTLTGTNVTVNPSSTISYSNSDFGSVTPDGVKPVVSTGHPFNSVSEVEASGCHSSAHWVGYGSAFRIKPNLFGTAAHCVFSRGAWSMPYQITLYVNQHGSSYESSLGVSKYIIPLDYFVPSNSESHDYAFLVTADDVGTDYLGFDSTETISVSDDLWTAGYPRFDTSGDMLWSMGETTSVDTQSGLIYADYPYTGGGSGSAVFKSGKLIGIHVGGTVVNDIRTGSIIQSLTAGFQNLYLSTIDQYL